MPRMDYAGASPEGFRAMMGLERHVRGSVDPALLHLIKVRASQINGCAYCLDMHWQDARADGESERRLYALNAWRESPFYTERERAVLGWTEALTLVRETGVPDAAFTELRGHVSEREIADLSWAIACINAWNRIAIGFRAEPGVYRPALSHRENPSLGTA